MQLALRDDPGLLDAPLPCILHWEQRHFVVLYRIHKGHYYIADPANKRIVVLDSSGALVNQYKSTEDDTLNDIRDISVSRDEKTLYVLNDTKIFEIPLQSPAEQTDSTQVEE